MLKLLSGGKFEQYMITFLISFYTYLTYVCVVWKENRNHQSLLQKSSLTFGLQIVVCIYYAQIQLKIINL